MTWLSVLLFTLPSLAAKPAAAPCSAQIAALDKATGEAVAPAFSALAACDQSMANEAFAKAVTKTGDTVSLAALAEAAVNAGLTPTVQGMLEGIPDYAAREEVVRALGARCMESEPLKKFVMGLLELKGRSFVSWAGAVRECQAPELTAALEPMVAAPPAVSFDDKYAAVVDLYAGKARASGLPTLEKAAMASMASGPFAVVIDATNKAVTPEGIGAKPSDADREALVAALQRVGANATPDAAQRIAGALVAIGATDAAASLLPKIYPNAVQSDGSFLYGVAAVETCGEDTVVHWAVIEEAGKLWSITEPVETRAKAFKPRLKCKDAAPYTVQITPAPVKEEDEVEAWAEQLAAASGDAKLREEKTISLQ
jgi:hypothetical protein